MHRPRRRPLEQPAAERPPAWPHEQIEDDHLARGTCRQPSLAAAALTREPANLRHGTPGRPARENLSAASSVLLRRRQPRPNARIRSSVGLPAVQVVARAAALTGSHSRIDESAARAKSVAVARPALASRASPGQTTPTRRSMPSSRRDRAPCRRRFLPSAAARSWIASPPGLAPEAQRFSWAARQNMATSHRETAQPPVAAGPTSSVSTRAAASARSCRRAPHLPWILWSRISIRPKSCLISRACSAAPSPHAVALPRPGPSAGRQSSSRAPVLRRLPRPPR